MTKQYLIERAKERKLPKEVIQEALSMLKETRIDQLVPLFKRKIYNDRTNKYLPDSTFLSANNSVLTDSKGNKYRSPEDVWLEFRSALIQAGYPEELVTPRYILRVLPNCAQYLNFSTLEGRFYTSDDYN